MTEYKLISAKGTRIITGSRDEAVEAAINMETELQPAFGISIENMHGETVAEIRDGSVDYSADPASREAVITEDGNQKIGSWTEDNAPTQFLRHLISRARAEGGYARDYDTDGCEVVAYIPTE